MPDIVKTLSSIKHFVSRTMAILVPVFLLAVAIYHALRPKVLELDWQSVTLLIFGVFLLFVPMRDFAGMIKTLQIGKLKIMLEQADELSESVANAEASEEADTPAPHEVPKSIEKEEEDEGEEGNEGGSSARRIPPKPPRTGPKVRPAPERPKVNDLSADSVLRLVEEMNRLTSVDSRAALIRLASYIEFAVLTLAVHALPGHNVRTFNEAVRMLFAQGWITPKTSDALQQFMRVRNNVAHLRTDREVSGEIVSSAISDGFRLIQLLRDIGVKHGDDPLTGETVPILN